MYSVIPHIKIADVASAATKNILILTLITVLVACSSGDKLSDCNNTTKTDYLIDNDDSIAQIEKNRCHRSKNTVGLILNNSPTSDGYILFTPILSKMTYLIDKQGRRIHSWASVTKPYSGGMSVYLLPNGHLLRNTLFPPLLPTLGKSFGNHGSIRAIEEYDWDNKLIWSYSLSNDQFQLHHDIAPLPNGNILVIAWERLHENQSLKLGRDPALLKPSENNELWAEVIMEIKPDYIKGSGGNIVWEWHIIDHLVQDFDPKKENYYGPTGVQDHPERININYVSTGRWKNPVTKDWVHLNAIDYNPETDQIILSSREFSEFWIIDHNTTSKEAAGKKGDLRYRYGNPRTYKQGTADNQTLFYQHNAHWIKKGLPGAGNILVFNNGAARPGNRKYSSVLELAPKMQKYGQADIVWKYEGSAQSPFYSPVISSAQRLSNGNTFINEGINGRMFEVTPNGETIWNYINPDTLKGPLSQGEKIPTYTIFNIPNVSLNLTFRATQIEPNALALTHKKLLPEGTIEK